jgi:hypothetical protein
MALRREIVDLGRQKRHIAGVAILIEMIDPGGVERGRALLDVMHGVAEAEQIFGEVRAVLPGDPRVINAARCLES